MLKFASSTRHVARFACLTLGIGSLTVVNVVSASDTDSQSDNPQNETAEPMPHSTVDGPWHFTNIRMTLEEAPTDIESFCVTVRVEADVTGDVPIYISPINQRINEVPLYGGIQDGEKVAYSEVVEIVNPFDKHADAPAMARSKYRDSGEIATRAGIATGSHGNAKTVLHSAQ